MITMILKVMTVYIVTFVAFILCFAMTIYTVAYGNIWIAIALAVCTVIITQSIYVGMGAYFGVNILKGIRK